MKDVFISYASEDRPLAERLAGGLEEAGLSVWWDRQIQVGSEWDKTIEEALAAATCVVVLWTMHAKGSRWVRAEARHALNQHKLIPVLVEANALPLGFTGIQALRFLQWDGSGTSQEFSVLLSVLRAQLAGKPLVLPESSSTKTSVLDKSVGVVGRVIEALGVKSTLTALGLVLLLLSSQWTIDPKIRAHIKTPRITFSVVPGKETGRLTDALKVRELSFEKVKRLSLSPDRFQVADPEQLGEKPQAFPPEAWQVLFTDRQEVSFTTSRPATPGEVTMVAAPAQGVHAFKLDPIFLAEPSKVSMELSGNNSITLSIWSESEFPKVLVSNVRAVELIQSGLLLGSNLSIPFSQDQELTYYAEFGDGHGLVTVAAESHPFVLVFNEGSGKDPRTDEGKYKTLVAENFPIQSINWAIQDPATGKPKIPKQFSGTLEYLDPKGMPGHEFTPDSALHLDELDHFEITSIAVDPSTHVFAVEMQGGARVVRKGTKQNAENLRPTVFDIIHYLPVLKPLRNLIGL